MDPTMKPGLGSARCPSCLSLVNPNYEKGEWTITPVLHDSTAVLVAMSEEIDLTGDGGVIKTIVRHAKADADAPTTDTPVVDGMRLLAANTYISYMY